MERVRRLIIGMVLLLNSMVAAAQEFYNLTAQEVRIDSVLPLFTYTRDLGLNYADSIYTVSIDYPEFIDMSPVDIARLHAITSSEIPEMPVVEQYIGVSPNGRKADDQTKAATQMITLYKKIYAAAEQAQIQDITLIDIRDVRAITLMYQNRLTLHLGTQDSLEQKLKTAAKTIAVESDASRTRTGAIDLTSIPYVYSRDTYETIGEEASTEVTEPESETEKAE